MSLCSQGASSFGSSEGSDSAASFCPSVAVWETNEEAHSKHPACNDEMAPITELSWRGGEGVTVTDYRCNQHAGHSV